MELAVEIWVLTDAQPGRMEGGQFTFTHDEPESAKCPPLCSSLFAERLLVMLASDSVPLALISTMEKTNQILSGASPEDGQSNLKLERFSL